MTPLAAFANFVVLEGLITLGNAAQTAGAILNAERTFRLAIASLLVVAVLGLIVPVGVLVRRRRAATNPPDSGEQYPWSGDRRPEFAESTGIEAKRISR